MNKKIKILIYMILLLFAIAALYPLFHIFITSFKQEVEYLDNRMFLPHQWVWDNYKFAIERGNMLVYFKNNFILIPLTMVFYLFVCITAGFAFGRLKFPFRLSLFMGVLFLMIFPQMLLSMQVFHVCSKLKLINTYLGVVLVWTAY